MDQLPPLPTFVHDLGALDAPRRQIARDAARGLQVRLSPGAYLETTTFTQLDARKRYIARVVAVARTRRFPVVVSHWSAAAIHGMPIIGPWPSDVHVTTGKSAGGRSRNGVVKHSLLLRDEDVVEVEGLLVTSIARTVIDMAAALPFMNAVVIADRAILVDRFGRRMPWTDKQTLLEQWESMKPFRAFARAAQVIDFAESRSESPLESVSRVNMWTLGCPKPELQVPQMDLQGTIGETDFAWRTFNAVAEADGDVKYLDPAYRNGRSIEQVILDEKIREDRIRAIPRAFSRWRWAVGINPRALREKLVRLGLPTGKPW